MFPIKPIKPFDLFLESVDYDEHKVYVEEEEEDLAGAMPEAEPADAMAMALAQEPTEAMDATMPSDELSDIASVADFDDFMAQGVATDSDPLSTPFDSVATDAGFHSATGMKVVILSAVEAVTGDTPLSDNVVAALTQKLEGCEVKEVKMYQLNIQPVNPKLDAAEPLDGMMMVYDALNTADVVVVSVEAQEDKIPYLMHNSMGRLLAHYKDKQLRNRLFASVVTGTSTCYKRVRNELTNTFLDLGLLTTADCHIFCGSAEQNATLPDYEVLSGTLAAALQQISEATAALRQPIGDENTLSSSAITTVQNFDEFESGGSVVPTATGGMEDQEEVAPTEAPAESAPAEMQTLEEEPVAPDEAVMAATAEAEAPEAAPTVETEEEEIYVPMQFNDFERSRIPGYVPNVPGVTTVRSPQR